MEASHPGFVVSTNFLSSRTTVTTWPGSNVGAPGSYDCPARLWERKAVTMDRRALLEMTYANRLIWCSSSTAKNDDTN